MLRSFTLVVAAVAAFSCAPEPCDPEPNAHDPEPSAPEPTSAAQTAIDAAPDDVGEADGTVEDTLVAANDPVDTSEAALVAMARALFGGGPRASTKKAAPQFAWPLEGRISSGFGVRHLDEDGGRESIHDAIDIVANVGSEVRAPADVVVRYVGFRNSAGRFVIADSNDGAWTFTFAHLSHVDVFEGDRVARGEVVGLTGATGNVTGPHLHFRIERVDANGRTAVDPVPLLAHVDGALPPAN